MTNRHRDLSLERSKFAWECATTAKRMLGNNYKEYVTLVKNVPTSLSNNGLGQTLAFLNSKPNNNSYNRLFRQLQDWLEIKIYLTTVENADKNIIKRIQTGEVNQYRWATKEMMEFITWLKLHSSSLNIEPSSNNASTKATPDITDKTNISGERDESKKTIELKSEITAKSLEEEND